MVRRSRDGWTDSTAANRDPVPTQTPRGEQGWRAESFRSRQFSTQTNRCVAASFARFSRQESPTEPTSGPLWTDQACAFDSVDGPPPQTGSGCHGEFGHSRTARFPPGRLKCERQESNLHGLPRWILSPVRLPVPPLSLGMSREHLAPRPKIDSDSTRHRPARVYRDRGSPANERSKTSAWEDGPPGLAEVRWLRLPSTP